MASGTFASLDGVWGSGPDNVFAVGESGTVLHHDGHGWLPVNRPGGEPHAFRAISSPRKGLFFIVGETMIRVRYTRPDRG